MALSLLSALWVHASPGAVPPAAKPAQARLQIQSVTAGGRPARWRPGGDLRLGARPGAVTFNFGPASNSNWAPIRLRYKLEGYDEAWREGQASMCLTVRFSDEHGDQISQRTFEVTGESAGWNGTLTNSTLSHRRETLVAPALSSHVWVAISSGCGPPATVGVYLVDDLVVSRLSSNTGVPEVLLHPVLGADSAPSPPPDWVRDGIRPSMAKIVEYGREPELRALAIVDDDPASHAEWHNVRETAPRVAPNDRLLIEWNELFSLGLGDTRSASYAALPAGDFRFRVQALTALGVPTGEEDTLRIHVPVPLWNLPLFWLSVATTILAVWVLITRYLTWYKMRREVAQLREQRALEQERLRIAQDIHDDLGARATQIALLSAMAQGNPSLAENARLEFNHISRMTRELISALYETVWAVNPENDNLDALGNYLCQMVNELCTQARLRCRLGVMDLPRTIQISSQTRHNVTMAVKEAVHNIIKHAHAQEVTLLVELQQERLSISVQDDGCGFDPSTQASGSGLTNMQRRLAEVGGTCRILSEAGRGSRVEMELRLRASGQLPRNPPAAKNGRATAGGSSKPL